MPPRNWRRVGLHSAGSVAPSNCRSRGSSLIRVSGHRRGAGARRRRHVSGGALTVIAEQASATYVGSSSCRSHRDQVLWDTPNRAAASLWLSPIILRQAASRSPVIRIIMQNTVRPKRSRRELVGIQGFLHHPEDGPEADAAFGSPRQRAGDQFVRIPRSPHRAAGVFRPSRTFADLRLLNGRGQRNGHLQTPT